MKKQTHTTSPLVPTMTAVGTGAIATAVAAMGLWLWPIAVVSAPLLWAVSKRGVAHDVDRVGAKGADNLAAEWKRNKKAGERGVDISKTIYSGGALFDLPMTRRYRYTLDQDELECSEQEARPDAPGSCVNDLPYAPIGKWMRDQDEPRGEEAPFAAIRLNGFTKRNSSR